MITYCIINQPLKGNPEKINIEVIANDMHFTCTRKRQFFKIGFESRQYFEICAELLQACSMEIKRQKQEAENSKMEL